MPLCSQLGSQSGLVGSQTPPCFCSEPTRGPCPIQAEPGACRRPDRALGTCPVPPCFITWHSFLAPPTLGAQASAAVSMPGMVPPRPLCMCYFLGLDSSFPTYLYDLPLISLKTSQILSEIFSDLLCMSKYKPLGANTKRIPLEGSGIVVPVQTPRRGSSASVSSARMPSHRRCSTNVR